MDYEVPDLNDYPDDLDLNQPPPMLKTDEYPADVTMPQYLRLAYWEVKEE